jgi:ferric-dicitrate binding protein FerR (iron transport regulator)
LAVLLVGALALYWWQQPVTQTAPRGERLAFRLPDGSRVELNSGSTLRYEREFGDERIVRLDGEAFFDVTDGSRSFVVRTFNADVRVSGTRFNVRAWTTDPAPSTLVTLVEGRVTLHPQNDPGRTVRLDPGDTRRVAHAQSDSVRAVDVSVDAVTAWRRGDLIFKDRPLGQVLREVERRFAVELTLQPSSLQRQRIYLALRQPDNVEAVIRDIARAQNLRYRATSNGYALYR